MESNVMQRTQLVDMYEGRDGISQGGEDVNYLFIVHFNLHQIQS